MEKENSGFLRSCHGPRRKSAESVTRARVKIDAKCMAEGVWALAGLPRLVNWHRGSMSPVPVTGHPEWHAEEAVPPEPPITVSNQVKSEPLQISQIRAMRMLAPQFVTLLHRIRLPFPRDLIVYYLYGRFPLPRRPSFSS